MSPAAPVAGTAPAADQVAGGSRRAGPSPESGASGASFRRALEAAPAAPPRLPLVLAAAAATMGAATTLSAVLAGLGWWLPAAAGAVLVAAVAGGLVRVVRRRVPVPLVLTVLPGLAAGLLYVTALCAPFTGRLGFLPTRRTPGALRDLASQGMHDIAVLAPPVAERRGLVLLIVAGVLVVALLVDAIAVTARRPALAGLPLLTLVAVPAAVAPHGVPAFAFLLAAGGYVGLLLIGGGHLESWGTVIGPRPDEVRRGRASAGRRIGLGAVLAALVVPALLPSGLSRGWLDGAGGGGTGTGAGSGGATLVVQPLVTIDQQLRTSETVPLLRVRTTRPEYLRLTALEQYDGTSFRLGRLSAPASTRVSSGLPPVPAGAGAALEASIDIDTRLAQRYLPLPYRPIRIAAKGDWRLEAGTGTVLSTHTDTSGLRYSASAQVPLPTAAELRTLAAVPTGLPPVLQADLYVGNLDPQVLGLLASLTNSSRTPYDAVAAIQAYLRGPSFRYDLQGAPAPGPGALRQFLLQDRRGYCQQFATAMTLLVRAYGLPARVGVGFTQGVQQPDGSWLVTNHDAHAWPEVWFPQAGWVRFEPTPRTDSTDAPPTYTTPADAGAPGTTAVPLPDRATGTGQQATTDLSRLPSEDRAGVALPPVDGVGAVPATRQTGRLLLYAGVAGMLVLLLAPIPAIVRWRRRRRRLSGAGPAHAAEAWREVLDAATDLGVLESTNGSPRQLAGRLAALLKAGPSPTGERLVAASDAALASVANTARFTLEVLVAAEERRRFRPVTLGAGGEPECKVDAAGVRALLSALRRASAQRQRMVATLLPRTVVGPVSTRVRSMLVAGGERWTSIADRGRGLLGGARRRRGWQRWSHSRT